MAEDEVEMKDAPSADAMDVDSKPVESIENDPNQEDDADDDNDQDAASDGDEAEGSGRPVSNQQYKELKRISDVLTNYKIKIKHRNVEEEHFPATIFKRLPNKRNLPDYYHVIKRPSAISTLKGKIQRKQYGGIPEFVEDFALIVHNAQVFNRPNSAPVRDVLRLDAVFKEEMKKLIELGLVKEEETVYPDLGVIPDATPEPDPVSEDEEDVDDDQDEDEEDDGDDSDDERRKKRGRRARTSIGGKKPDKEDEENDDKAGDAEQKRRGRPPKVDTPMEARIKSILKGIRKYKNEKGQPLVYDFEKLPDKAEHPAYYTVISNPVALDGIKKKAKRKKYDTVDQFMKDITVMFNNAMAYNEDGSEIHTNARELLEEAKKLAQIEKDKPDSEYLMQDGRLPLPYISHNGKMWRVGDWIHIQNINDVTKPIVAQIYRTWQDSEDRKWINACWYYRPEQTVHQYEKHFFPNEVVKTGQYRDHSIEEALDHCFVMFFTRYGKGRPRGIDPSTEVYVCESRYNEEKFKFNKIKTWASCLPDEVRDKDYEMDLFDVPKKVKKLPSPLLYLVNTEAKEDEEIPQPIWGAQNAPPKQGAIYKRPRDENQSPPPEPTPPPPPTPPPVVRQPSANLMPQQRSQPGVLHRQGSGISSTTNAIPHLSPSLPQTPFQFSTTTPTTQFNRHPFQQTTQQTPYAINQAQTPIQTPPVPYVSQQNSVPPANLGAAHPGNYGAGAPGVVFQRAPGPPFQAQQQTNAVYQVHNAPNYSGHDGRAPECYVLSDAANDALPQEIRDRFRQDEAGRLLFFTQPAVRRTQVIEDKIDSRGKGQPLQHTDRYIERMAEIKRMRAARVATTERDAADKKRKQGSEESDSVRTSVSEFSKEKNRVWGAHVRSDTGKMSSAEIVAAISKIRQREMQQILSQGPMTQNFWTGRFEDDYDSRLPPFS